MSSSPSVVVDSEISAVTVFSRGAEVTRQAEVRPINGRFPDWVSVEGLPLSLDDSSIRAAVSGPDAPTAAEVHLALDVPSPDARLPPPRDDDLEAAEGELRAARREVELLERDLVLLDELNLKSRPPAAEGEPPRPSPLTARLDLVAFREARARKLLDALAKARQGAEAAAEALAVIQEAIARASTARQPHPHELRKTAVVRLRAPSTPAAGPAQLRLSYLVSGARWSPSYVVRLEPDLSRAEVQVRALVRQLTGEDWSEVALSLSTAAPERWSEVPELKALRIGRAQPRPRPSWRPPPAGTEALFASFDARVPSRPPDATAEVELSAILEEAPAPLAASIASAAQTGSMMMSPPELDADEEAPIQELPDVALGVFGGGLAGAAPEAMLSGIAQETLEAAPPPAPKMAKRSSKPAAPAGMARARRRAPARGGGGPPAPSAPPVPELDARLSHLGNLKMPGPHEPRRGLLTAMSRIEVSTRWLVEEKVSVVRALWSQVKAQRRHIASFESQSPSPGHCFAETHDGFDYTFVASHPSSVVSDGADHLIVLKTHACPARPRYVCVPRETQDVFRIVNIENPEEAPLLRAPIDVYVGDEYMLTADGRSTPPGGTLELGLGVEQGLKVARNTRFEEQSSGLIRGSLEIAHEIQVELRSNLDQAARCEVRERLPVPRKDLEDDIKVQVETVEPPWKPFEEASSPLHGGHVWTVEVPAGESRTLFARYTIRIPSGQELVGGNRREA